MIPVWQTQGFLDEFLHRDVKQQEGRKVAPGASLWYRRDLWLSRSLCLKNWREFCGMWRRWATICTDSDPVVYPKGPRASASSSFSRRRWAEKEGHSASLPDCSGQYGEALVSKRSIASAVVEMLVDNKGQMPHERKEQVPCEVLPLWRKWLVAIHRSHTEQVLNS